MREQRTSKYVNREISWLDFNARVLQEASEESVPLIERLRFLGIFSNNLDEFFQVRFATVKRISQSDLTGKKALGGIVATELLEEITGIVIEQQRQSLSILKDIEEKLSEENIIFLNEKEVNPHQEKFLNDFFNQHVGPALVTVILHDEIQDFSDNKAFLVITLNTIEKGENKLLYALIEIPKQLDRFVVLPKEGDLQHNIKKVFRY